MEKESSPLGTLAEHATISRFTGHTGFSRVVYGLPAVGPDVHR